MGTGNSVKVKQVERDADHWPLSTAETKNEWSYTSTPPTRLHGVHKNNFTVTFTFTFTSNFTFTSTECQGQIVAFLCRVRESRVEISDHGRAILSHCHIVVSCPSVRPSVRMYRHGSHWTDFCEIWHCGLFWKSAHKIHIWLQQDKNIRPSARWRQSAHFLVSGEIKSP
jgi:hypothetical protein